MPTEKKSLFIGIVVKDNDALIPFFLRSLEKLDYDKQLIAIQFNICNSSPEIHKLISTWAVQEKKQYGSIEWIDSSAPFTTHKSVIEKNRIFAEIKDSYLTQCQAHNSDLCCILSSDVFLLPHTLSFLAAKNEPIIAPLLRPAPESPAPFRNFFADVTESGYYKDHPDYREIAYRHKKGTFKVPCVSVAYIIKKDAVDSLSFTQHFVDWELVSFSKSAREKNIDQYICNEKEFGFFLYSHKELTHEEERAFTLAGTDVEVDSPLLEKILSKHLEDDASLKRYAEQFDFNEYAIYRVQNRDLFYVDDVPDYIKNYIIKQGLPWEEHIQQQFRKYVRPGTVALDIGGHIGTHSLSLSKLIGTNGEVHVFEPQAKMFCELAINMHLNNCSNVHIHHRALGAHTKWIEMSIPPEEWTQRFSHELINEGHGTVFDAAENSSGDRAKMVLLDSYNLNNISFIKMDVEGHELDVIKGGIETIKRNKPVMIIEIFDTSEKANKISTIESLGYIHSRLSGDDYLFIPQEMVKKPQNQALSEQEDGPLVSKSHQEIDVTWDGTFLDFGSLSHVNRSLTEALSAIQGIHLSYRCPQILLPPSNTIPELATMQEKILRNSPQKSDITVRHSWPPNWSKPSMGKLVVIQPWEYGYLPEEWVRSSHAVDEIWVPTHYVKKAYVNSGIAEEKVQVIPNGINPSIYNPQAKPYPLKTQKKFKFVYVGGAIYRKGIDTLLNTYTKTFSSSDNVSLIIKDFGTQGPYKHLNYEADIRAAQNRPNAPEIIYLNDDLTSEEIAGLYTACDCLLYPYRGEGFALPVLEAMACGIPVVVTAGGATDDFVTDECGWFLPSSEITVGPVVGNMKLVKESQLLEADSDVFSALIQWLVRHPSEVQKKGVFASTYAKTEWTWQKAAQKAARRLRLLASNREASQ